MFRPRHLLACLFVLVAVAHAASLRLTPFHANGIYARGEPAGWTIETTEPSPRALTYTLKRNNAVVLQAGTLDFHAGPARVAATVNEPAMLLLEINDGATPVLAGAAVAPEELRPTAERPADFDAFWARQLELLRRVPLDPVLTPGESDRPDVAYATIRLNNIAGSHVYGQIARPAREGRFPALLIMQWASPPYPLQKAWVTQRAAEGWLAMNVEPHDVPGDMPPAFYAALPQLIKEYQTIYNDDRDRNYFLRMYLGDYRALDYLASRPDWNGRILVVTGASMGGQQSFAVAGLHPKVTHMIVHVPAGADARAALHGRQAGYPNWDASNPKVMATAPYFDTVNFAPRIHARCLVSMGFVDTTCPPAGVWTAFNQIAGPKEAVPLIDAGHNNHATPEQQRAYTDRSAAWLAHLVRGEEP